MKTSKRLKVNFTTCVNIKHIFHNHQLFAILSNVSLYMCDRRNKTSQTYALCYRTKF